MSDRPAGALTEQGRTTAIDPVPASDELVGNPRLGREDMIDHPQWCSRELCTADQPAVAGRDRRHQGVPIPVDCGRFTGSVWLQQRNGEPAEVGITVAWHTIAASGSLSSRAATALGVALIQAGTSAAEPPRPQH
jgi:hypothetical protein